ncbi:MAG: DUF308 domain-containing protein [Pseudomonadota bacterium]
MTKWYSWMGVGLLMVVGAFFILGNAMVASIAVTQLVGIVFLIAGGVQAVASIMDREQSGWFITLVLGLLGVFIGWSFLSNPLEGMVSLTLLVAILLLLAGGVRLWLAFKMRESPFFWLLLLSGAVAILLAAWIFANFATASMTVLGILFGVEVLMNGITMIVMSLAIKRGDMKLGA